MIVDELTEILAVPTNPTESGMGQNWARITSYFGKTLPGDYMAFVDRYGSGEIGGWLTVLNPFSRNSNLSLIDQFFSMLAAISVIKSDFPDTCPYPLMFEPGGLMPWGFSIDGDIFCWLTDGLSGKWRIVVMGRHSQPEEFDGPMSRFIKRCICGEISPLAIPEDWSTASVTFVPYRTEKRENRVRL